MRTHKIDRLNVRVNAEERKTIDLLKQELGLQSDSEFVRFLIREEPQRRSLATATLGALNALATLADLQMKQNDRRFKDSQVLGAIDERTQIIYEKLRDADSRHY